MTVYDTTSLAYDLNILLTQKAPIERDVASEDKFGGEVTADRVVIGSTRCRFYWWRSEASRSASREFAEPQRTVFFTGGGIIVPLGTEIRDHDHVEQIETPEGALLVPGPFRVVAVERWEDHLDCALMRP